MRSARSLRKSSRRGVDRRGRPASRAECQSLITSRRQLGLESIETNDLTRILPVTIAAERWKNAVWNHLCRWRSFFLGANGIRLDGRRNGGVVAGFEGAGAAMIPVPSGGRVWIATGHTDMRRGMQGLALQVQESLHRDPHAGDLYIFRGRRGDLAKILWHDGIGLSLYAKRLDRGRFIWPSATEGAVSISAAQMAYMLEGIDWRNPQLTWRPRSAG
jgi:transposase